MAKQNNQDDNEVLDVQPVTEAQERAQINQQIATAKKYPRSIQNSKDELVELAAGDAVVADECFYQLPRGGKTIDGPSVRMAELVEYCWGNMRTETRVVDVGDKFVTAQGSAADLERNNAVRAECQRRITNSRGQRYGDDMIQVTANAAASIAYRNAIFKLVPPAVFRREFRQIKEARHTQDLSERVSKIQKLFSGHWDITPDQLLEQIGSESWDKVEHGEIDMLCELATAIIDGTTSVEEVFEGQRPSQKARQGSDQQDSDQTQSQSQSQPQPQSDADQARSEAEEALKMSGREKPAAEPEEEPKGDPEGTDGSSPEQEQEKSESEPETEPEPAPEDEPGFDVEARNSLCGKLGLSGNRMRPITTLFRENMLSSDSVEELGKLLDLHPKDVLLDLPMWGKVSYQHIYEATEGMTDELSSPPREGQGQTSLDDEEEQDDEEGQENSSPFAAATKPGGLKAELGTQQADPGMDGLLHYATVSDSDGNSGKIGVHGQGDRAHCELCDEDFGSDESGWCSHLSAAVDQLS